VPENNENHQLCALNAVFMTLFCFGTHQIVGIKTNEEKIKLKSDAGNKVTRL